MDEKLTSIQEMGWTPSEAQDALTAARGNLEAAVNWLLEKRPQGGPDVGPPPPSNPQPAAQGGNSDRTSSPYIPPPPLDASDAEEARHLDALKRNYSTEFPPGHQAAEGRPHPSSQNNQTSNDQQPPPPVYSPPSSPSIGDFEPITDTSAAFHSPLTENAPKVKVCYRSTGDRPQLEETEKLLELLRQQHIPCTKVDINEDRDLDDTISAGNANLPQAVQRFQPLGDLREFSNNLSSLRRLIAQRIAEDLQAEHSSTLDEYRSGSVSTGAVDGVLTIISSAANRLWSSSAPAPANRPTDNFIEFTVIKTNWFYRDQRRIIRFGSTGEFHRFDPTTRELRESVRYDAITSIAVGPGKLTLGLSNGTMHSFAAPAIVIDYMFQLFLAYSRDTVVPTFQN